MRCLWGGDSDAHQLYAFWGGHIWAAGSGGGGWRRGVCGETVTMADGPFGHLGSTTELHVQADDVRFSKKGSHVRGMNLKNCCCPASLQLQPIEELAAEFEGSTCPNTYNNLLRNSKTKRHHDQQFFFQPHGALGHPSKSKSI